MAIANIIAAGIGFSPGSVKFIPVRGFLAGAAPPLIPAIGWIELYRDATFSEPARSSGWVEPYRDAKWPYRA